jgi:serine/threonine-protein kinase
MALASFADKTVERLRKMRVDLALLSPVAVAGSLFSGAPGVAFFLLEAARLRKEDRLLGPARAWLDAGVAWAETAGRAEWKEIEHGFFIGASGLAYVDALLRAREGDPAGATRAIDRLERGSSSFEKIRADFRATEVVGGHAGIVLAARDLDARLPAGPEYAGARESLARVRDRAAAALLAAHREPIERDGKERRGFAHGLAGELWTLLAAVGVREPRVAARLAELAALAEEDEEGLVYWLPSRDEADTSFLGTWCNGMAGQTLLWTEVLRLRRTKKAKRLAARSAETLYVLLSANPSVCCGLAGQALALQRYADVAGDPVFDRRAYARLKRAATLVDRAVPGKPGGEFALSFWQGSLGVALAALARLHHERFVPCLEPFGAAGIRVGSQAHG